MTECKFCERLEESERKRIFNNKWDKDCVHNEYTVALVIRIKRHRRLQGGRTVSFRNQGLGFKLNYCPECGREIKEAKNGK